MWVGLGFLFTTPNNEDPVITNSDGALFFHEHISVKMVWIHIKYDILSGLISVRPNCLQSLSKINSYEQGKR